MPAPVDPRAGTHLTASALVDPVALARAYHDGRPDVLRPAERVSFGNRVTGVRLSTTASMTRTSRRSRR